MSYTPYSSYSHDTNYGNYDDGAYHLSDGAYHSTGYNHLGNDYGNNSPSPEPHEEYDELLIQCAAKHGITPRELYEANEECIREQNEWEREVRREEEEAQMEMRERKWQVSANKRRWRWRWKCNRQNG